MSPIIARTDEHPDYYLSQAENEYEEVEAGEEEVDLRHDHGCRCAECVADEIKAKSAEALADMLQGKSDERRMAA